MNVTKQNIIALIVFLILGISWFIYDAVKHKRLYSKLQKEYPVLNSSDSLNNVLNYTYYPSNWRGEQFNQYVAIPVRFVPLCEIK